MKPVHFSTLKQIGRSPKHYLAALEGNRPDSAPMRLGRLVHFIVLGGDHVIYDGRRAGAEWDEFKAAHPDSEIFTRSEYDDASPIADAVLADLDAGPLLVGERELPIAWSMAGRDCAGRVDVLGADFITDLKTCADASPGRFSKQAMRMGYHAQLDWYGNGVELAGLGNRPARFIVAVESKPPHVVQCYEFTDAALEQGRKLWWTWWERLLACERANNWPGYINGIFPIDAEDELIFGEEAA